MHIHYTVPHLCNHCCQVMQYIPYLGRFTELQKVTISFVMSVCLHGNQLPLDRFSWNLILEYFLKICHKIQVSLKSDRNNGYLTWRPIHFWSYLTHFSLEWEMFQTKVAEKIKTRILCSTTFSENLAVYEIMWKNMEQTDRPLITVQ